MIGMSWEMSSGPIEERKDRMVFKNKIEYRARINSRAGSGANRNSILHGFFLFVATIMMSLPLLAQEPVSIPELTGRVVDRAGVLSREAIGTLNSKLSALEQEKGAQIVVLTVPTTKPEPIEAFSIRVADAWKIGRKGVDDGILVLVATEDHRVRIEVGYGLEGAIPDIYAKRIIRETIIPRFRRGDLEGGILAGVDRLGQLVRGEDLPAVKPGERDTKGGRGFPAGAFWVILGIGLVARSIFGRVLGTFLAAGVGFAVAYLLSGFFVAIFVGLGLLFFVSIFGPGRRGSGLLPMSMGGFSGPPGGFGGGSGFGGFGGGGFGGGGGSFGGGGASGGW